LKPHYFHSFFLNPPSQFRPTSVLNSDTLQPILSKEEEDRLLAEYQHTGATTNIHPVLSSLINYTHPVKFGGFDLAERECRHESVILSIHPLLQRITSTST
jgi:hypothetical protein